MPALPGLRPDPWTLLIPSTLYCTEMDSSTLKRMTLERRVTFLLRMLGSSATHGDPLLSEAAKLSVEFEPEGRNFDEGVGQSWGDHMDDILPPTEYMGMEEDPSNFTVSINNIQLSVLSEDELSLASRQVPSWRRRLKSEVEMKGSLSRGQGIRTLDYLDDLLILLDSAYQANTHMSQLVTHLKSLGFIINWKKCCLTPSQKMFSRSGFGFYRQSCQVVQGLLQLHHIVSLHQYQCLLGLMASMIPVVLLDLLMMRKFQCWVQDRQVFFSRQREDGHTFVSEGSAPMVRSIAFERGSPSGPGSLTRPGHHGCIQMGLGSPLQERACEWDLDR
eukprot:superscaffoldBa00001062_g8753